VSDLFISGLLKLIDRWRADQIAQDTSPAIHSVPLLDSSDVGADAEIWCPFPQLHISDLMEVSFTSALRKVLGKNGLSAATSDKWHVRHLLHRHPLPLGPS
jgi:hypothetical protein